MTKIKSGQPALQAQETGVKTITRSAALKNKNMKPGLTGAFALSLVALGIALGSGATAQAQTADWPTRPVRIIVPYSPGGGTDIISRRLAQVKGIQKRISTRISTI